MTNEEICPVHKEPKRKFETEEFDGLDRVRKTIYVCTRCNTSTGQGKKFASELKKFQQTKNLDKE